MDVFLVPAGPSRHALYCELAAPAVSEGDDQAASWLGRMKVRFRRAVDEGEAAEDGRGVDDPSHGRFRRFVTRKLAEAVAEQRLLWHVRHIAAARLVHPDTLDGPAALAIARAEFEADYRRHRRWLIIDGLLTAVTGPLFFFVPGPNVVSWYFTFRAIGHFFSMRGARHALSAVAWTCQASSHLTTVGEAITLPSDRRAAQLDAAGDALGLARLVRFVERVADRAA